MTPSLKSTLSHSIFNRSSKNFFNPGKLEVPPVKKIFWNFLAEREDPSGVDDGIFWYTGLVYDGSGNTDKGEDVKKLSGIGRFGRLPEPTKLGDLAQVIKKQLGLDVVTVAGPSSCARATVI